MEIIFLSIIALCQFLIVLVIIIAYLKLSPVICESKKIASNIGTFTSRVNATNERVAGMINKTADQSAALAGFIVPMINTYKVFSKRSGITDRHNTNSEHVEKEGLRMENRDHLKKLLGFAAGIAIGSALGILFAPKSGKETREHIKGVTEDTEDKIKDFIKKGEEFLERGK